jgi:hypothetical protein
METICPGPIVIAKPTRAPVLPDPGHLWPFKH